MSGIGISGCHGVGKTTLAKAFSNKFNVAFVSSRASQVIADAGFDARLSYGFSDRLRLQSLILESALEDYCAASGGAFVTDRTPLDYLAYLLSDVGRNNVEGEDERELLDYRQRCFDAMNDYFNVIIVVQPGIALTCREGKGTPNQAYLEHFNAIVCGLSVDPQTLITATHLPRGCVDLRTRVLAVGESVTAAFNLFERTSAKKGATHFSSSTH